MRQLQITLITILFFGLLAGVPAAQTADQGETPAEDSIGRTPPRLSLVEGEVSFWRPGAEEWVQAQVNVPLAPGDQLFAGPNSRMEIQIGAQAFVRTGGDTQIGLESREPDFLQFKVTSGRACLDLRHLDTGRLIEMDTPNAAFTIGLEGYYRLDAGDERTLFITRRAGRATAISAEGDKIAIPANTAITFEGETNPAISSEGAPGPDALDQWNYARTEQLLAEQNSARYVSPESYGVSELDRYGTWQVAPTYGAVWVPSGVGPDWAPYSTGVWMNDPFYGWTWVDTAPWGWAPYHYGRWVRYRGLWCWAPGPRVLRPVYAPALVAFFGAPGVQVTIGVGAPLVGWVPLGWGEPLVPWWGRPGFIHRPWWGGWHGPHVVNGVVVRNRVVSVAEIHTYSHARDRKALIVVRGDRFGHGPITHERMPAREAHALRPIHGAPAVAARVGLVPSRERGPRPPESHLNRAVVRAHPSAATHGPRSEPAFLSRPDHGSRPAPGTSEPAVRPIGPSGPGAAEHGREGRRAQPNRPEPPQPPGRAHQGFVRPESPTPLPQGRSDSRPEIRRDARPNRSDSPQPQRATGLERSKEHVSPRAPEPAPTPSQPQPPDRSHQGIIRPESPPPPQGRFKSGPERQGGPINPPPAVQTEPQRRFAPNREGAPARIEKEPPKSMGAAPPPQQHSAPAPSVAPPQPERRPSLVRPGGGGRRPEDKPARANDRSAPEDRQENGHDQPNSRGGGRR